MLYCAFGSVGFAPAGHFPEFGVTVIEINSPVQLRLVNVSNFLLLSDRSSATLKRVVSVEIFDEPYVRGEGNGAFYLDTKPGGHTRPWDGTLTPGMIHLRVKVEFNEGAREWAPDKCRVTIGPYVIEGPVDGRWPT
jgi:hypothetical protein